MNITTKKGDQGNTSLVDGTRVSKTDLRVRTSGKIDKLNVLISSSLPYIRSKALSQTLITLAGDLRMIMSFISTTASLDASVFSMVISSLDEHIKSSPASFTLDITSTSKASNWLHLCRCQSREIEIDIVELQHQFPDQTQFKLLSVIFNRLSDYFYVLALENRG